MKKNIFLSLVLIALLVFTYYYQELGQVIRQSRENEQSKLLKGDIGRLKSISFKNYSVDPLDPVISQKKIDQFLDKISRLKIHRKISWLEVDKRERAAIESGFDHKITFLFQDKKIKYELGARVEFSHTFYVRVSKNGEKGQVFLCFDSSPRFTYYDPKKNDHEERYFKIVNLFSLPSSFFHQLKLFKNFSVLSRVEINHEKNQHFVAKIDKFETIPPVLAGLVYNKKEFEKFDKRFRSLEAARLLDHKNLLSKKIASIKWTGLDKGQLDLYRKYGNREGYFVLQGDRPYELSGLSASVFYYQLQDFWTKRPFGKVLDDSTSLTFQLEQGGKQESFHIPVSKKFSVEAIRAKKVAPKKDAFQRLFLLLFGASDHYQAQRVQVATEAMKKNFSNRNSLKIHILDKKIAVIGIKDEVLIWDQSTNLVFHYLVGPSFNLSFALSSFFDYNE